MTEIVPFSNHEPMHRLCIHYMNLSLDNPFGVLFPVQFISYHTHKTLPNLITFKVFDSHISNFETFFLNPAPSLSYFRSPFKPDFMRKFFSDLLLIKTKFSQLYTFIIACAFPLSHLSYYN